MNGSYAIKKQRTVVHPLLSFVCDGYNTTYIILRIKYRCRTADIISHDNGSEVFEGYPVEFRAVLSDVNHDIDELTARWKVNGEEVCPFLPPDQAGESVCVATINTGDEEITG